VGKKAVMDAAGPLTVVAAWKIKPGMEAAFEDWHQGIFAEWGGRLLTINCKLLGAATLDRIRYGAYKVILEGRSYRGSREDAALKNLVAGTEENT